MSKSLRQLSGLKKKIVVFLSPTFVVKEGEQKLNMYRELPFIGIYDVLQILYILLALAASAGVFSQ